MMPGPMDPINIYSELGGNSSVIIPFRNPTERQVVVDVIMKERLLSRSGEIFIVTFVIYNIVVFTKSVNSNFWRFDGSHNSEYPWLFTVLRPEPRWRVVSRHFRKTTFEL